MPHHFLQGEGEMAGRIRAFAWDATPLGAPEQWPAPLRTVTRLALTTQHPVFVMWGAELRCFYNDAYRASLGPEQHPAMLGAPAARAWAEIWPIIGPQVEQVMAGRGATWHRDHLVPFRRHGEHRPIYWTYSYSPIDDPDAPNGVGGVLMLCNETTEQVLAKQRLAEEDRRKDRFLAVLSHELRNPLAPIRTAATLLTMPGVPEADRARACEIVKRQSGHMARLLDDLLDIGRVTRGKLVLQRRSVELREVIDAAIETARSRIEERRHAFAVTLPDAACRLEADPLRLAQLIANLLTNAAKFTEPGGRLSLTAERAGSLVAIRVRDDGIGIEPGALESIFDMFSQAHGDASRAQGGLGIGLALARGLAELHGGSLAAFSAGPGHGSEFVLKLPVAG
ncbi:MAG TPA: HAMP domain-containing sensor histidine kinase [Methylibium sp.]|uniref:sensor histidine kinase n=1 Tax=Methylibium sp. TaxID=2067992 RepID=UPI002DBC828B|nr:HAMP domain-containing sensor histidine kinase [Methylibium sp.]HEU4459082.1 HAMP domain-containing sensor histidine kinase [Methylibium sp.]